MLFELGETQMKKLSIYLLVICAVCIGLGDSPLVAGLLANNNKPGTYARIERDWKAGDRIDLQLDLRARIVSSPDSGSRHAAVTRGPVVLARDSRLGSRDIDGPIRLTGDEEGVVPLESVAPPDGIRMAFRVPDRNGESGQEREMLLCDYASAGNTWDDRSRFRVWLPLST